VAVWSYLSLVAPLEVVHVGSLIAEDELEYAFKGKCKCEEKQDLSNRFPREKGRQGQNRSEN
jgi:hypothetical protein